MVSLTEEQSQEVIEAIHKIYVETLEKFTGKNDLNREPIGCFIVFDYTANTGQCSMLGDISARHVIQALKTQLEMYALEGLPKNDTKE